MGQENSAYTTSRTLNAIDITFPYALDLIFFQLPFHVAPSVLAGVDIHVPFIVELS